jgi:hypothetical protein
VSACLKPEGIIAEGEEFALATNIYALHFQKLVPKKALTNAFDSQFLHDFAGDPILHMM